MSSSISSGTAASMGSTATTSFRHRRTGPSSFSARSDNFSTSMTSDDCISESDANNEFESASLLLKSQKRSWRNWWIRFVWTFIMLTLFAAILLLRQYLSLLLIVLVKIAVFNEALSIAHVPSRAKRLPLFRLVSWYFFFATNYYFYGESLLRHFANRGLFTQLAAPGAKHHRFVSYSLYCFGLVLFVLSLKRGYYKFQFSQFAWTHMAILLIVVQAHAVISCMFEGLIWFFLPAWLVVANDVCAYVFGFFWGRTPLIRLSPKKTWEGFIGGAISTLIFGILAAKVLIKYPYFTCPPTEFTESFWSNVTCRPHAAFVKQPYTVPESIPYLGGNQVMIAPLEMHVIILALFAASIAPFGGFFASGLKRAFKIKDFGDAIPGHGGITDRMDCQFIMGTFSYIYVTSFIRRSGAGDVVRGFLLLTQDEQVAVYQRLTQYMAQIAQN